jgi:hypothetical protein
VIPVNKAASGNDATSLDVNQSGSTTNIPQGFGRIIRNCHGNIIDVEIGEQDGEATISTDEGVPIQDEEMEQWLGKHSNDSKSTALIQG